MDFSEETRERVAANGKNDALVRSAAAFMLESTAPKYSYNFTWMGRPIIQYPQDMVAMQELIWAVQPDLIIETGIAHGGSLVFSASMLALLEHAEAARSGALVDPRRPARCVLGVDIDIRAHNRAAIESHPMHDRIEMIQGSSIDPHIIAQVRERAARAQRVLVCLDSNHTHDHVLAELEAYAGLVSQGSYCCVFDTIVDHLPAGMYPDRPWGPGNNPKTAMREYLRRIAQSPVTGSDGRPLRFEIDKAIDNKLLISVAPEGFLRRVEDARPA